MKVEIDNFSTLGITFSSNYDLALNLSWKKICEKIKTRISIMSSRYLNVYQRAIIINAMISSKLWFTAHIYPLPLKYSILINKEIYKFIWNHYNVNPIKREILNRSKQQGGIGLLNIYYKAKSIFVGTIVKLFQKNGENTLLKYYMAIRINALFNIRVLPNKISYRNTPYYEYAVDTIRKCVHLKEFPNVNSKVIYSLILPNIKARIELLYPLYDWNNIWTILAFRFLNVYDRPIMFKCIH